MSRQAFLPGDRVAWYSSYATRVFSATVEAVATSITGEMARVRLDETGEVTTVECDRLSLIPDPRPAAVSAALALVSMLAEVRAALANNEASENVTTLKSVEAGLSALLAPAPKDVVR